MGCFSILTRTLVLLLASMTRTTCSAYANPAHLPHLTRQHRPPGFRCALPVRAVTRPAVLPGRTTPLSLHARRALSSSLPGNRNEGYPDPRQSPSTAATGTPPTSPYRSNP